MHMTYLARAPILTALLACSHLAVRPVSAAWVSSAPAPTAAVAADESGLAGAINSARTAAGLPALAIDPRLAEVARARSQDMVSRHYFAHVTPDGTTIFDLLDASAVDWSAAAENLAQSRGTDPVQTAIAGFLQSPEHRNNLFNRTYAHLGVGTAMGSDGSVILTAIFTN